MKDTSTNLDVLEESFTYRNPSDSKTTSQVATHRAKSADNYDVTWSYTYDKNGNILSVSDGTNTTSYVYDTANQLLRENNQAAGKTWGYVYDDAGNILSKKEYAYTTGTLGTVTDTISYVYGDENWGDLLTEWDGKEIEYDAIGNPKSIGSRTFSWKHGRELASLTDGTKTWNFTYNADGLRTKRTDGTTDYRYYYLDGQLIRLDVDGETLRFGYDTNGRPLTVTYKGYLYYYVTNIQGDVVAILNSSGEVKVKYTYDAWGNILSTTGSLANTLGKYNPLRYRGYVYDTETGLYYLKSRYYDPAIGRFLNADNYPSTGQGLLGNNMFAYCGNNPVARQDANGKYYESALDVIAIGADIAELVVNPSNLVTWGALAADVASLVVPCVSGGGALVRVATKADDVADTIKAVNTAENTVTTVKKLHRPYIRKSTRQAVEQAAKKAPDGRFLDANTMLPINGKYDLGHVYGHEFWRERDRAMALGWSQKQFNDYMNNPSFYQIEDPILNRSHIFEMR